MIGSLWIVPLPTIGQIQWSLSNQIPDGMRGQTQCHKILSTRFSRKDRAIFVFLGNYISIYPDLCCLLRSNPRQIKDTYANVFPVFKTFLDFTFWYSFQFAQRSLISSITPVFTRLFYIENSYKIQLLIQFIISTTNKTNGI